MAFFLLQLVLFYKGNAIHGKEKFMKRIVTYDVKQGHILAVWEDGTGTIDTPLLSGYSRAYQGDWIC